MTTKYSDSIIEAARGELEKLLQPVDAGDVKTEFLTLSVDDLLSRWSLPDYTTHGEISINKAGFGFVNNVYVPNKLARGMDGKHCVVRWVDGEKGPRCIKIVDAETYIHWHHDEIVLSLLERLKRTRESQAEEIRHSELYWVKLKDISKTLGFTLVALELSTISVNYGGRGEDSFTFEEDVDEESARRLLDALQLRHADDGSGSYDHGHDRITITQHGFRNAWVGPWTD